MLFVAIWHWKTALAILLLLSGAHVNAQWETGISPIHCAVLKGSITMIKILLMKEADIEIKEEHGLTPLDIAAMRGHQKAMKLLISRGAKIDNTVAQVVRRAIQSAPSISVDGGHLWAADLGWKNLWGKGREASRARSGKQYLVRWESSWVHSSNMFSRPDFAMALDMSKPSAQNLQEDTKGV